MNKLSKIALACTLTLSASSVFAQEVLNVWEDIQKSKGIAQAIADFEKEFDVKVNVLESPYAGQIEKLRLDGPAGIGPDVLIMPSDQLGAAVVQGLISPVTMTDEQKAQYTQSSIQAFTADGELYGYPKVVETLVMFYNKDKIAQPFETLDQYKQYSKSQKEGNFGLIAKFDQVYYAFGAMNAYGGYIFGQDDKGNYNVEDIGLSNAGSVEAVTYLKTFFDEGLIPSGIYGDNGLNAIDSLFTEQKAAAVINGPWALEPYQRAGVNFGVAPLPKMPNGKAMTSLLGVKGYVISSWSKNPELANKFVQYINQAKYAKIRFETTKEIPPVVEVINDPIIKDNEFASAIATQSQVAVPMPSIPEMSEVWNPINSALQLGLSGKQDVKGALNDATNQINSQIEAFRSGL